jgi:hypothetical protein
MSSLKCLHQACNEELRLILWKLSDFRVMVPQISTFHEIHDQVKKLIIMKSPLNIYNEIGFDFLHQLELHHY